MVCSRRSCPMTISWTASGSDIELPCCLRSIINRATISGPVRFFQREQVILGPNGISNFEETPRAQTRDRVVLRHPVRTAVDPSVVKRQVTVVSQCEGRQPEATSRTQLVRPPAQNPL